jgi:hypothetical protein
MKYPISNRCLLCPPPSHFFPTKSDRPFPDRRTKDFPSIVPRHANNTHNSANIQTGRWPAPPCTLPFYAFFSQKFPYIKFERRPSPLLTIPFNPILKPVRPLFILGHSLLALFPFTHFAVKISDTYNLTVGPHLY